VTSEISPFTVEQILTAYTLTRTMSVSDSRAIGEAIAVLRRHGEEYVKEVAIMVRNCDL
jgi:hypothetical protein